MRTLLLGSLALLTTSLAHAVTCSTSCSISGDTTFEIMAVDSPVYDQFYQRCISYNNGYTNMDYGRVCGSEYVNICYGHGEMTASGNGISDSQDEAITVARRNCKANLPIDGDSCKIGKIWTIWNPVYYGTATCN